MQTRCLGVDVNVPVVVDVVFEDPRWPAGFEALTQEACERVAARLGLPEDCEVVILAANDVRIAELNRAYRAKHQATNVLSWPAQDLANGAGLAPDRPQADFPDEGPALGDIALAYETCEAEALAAGLPFEAHLRHLVVHGMMHLLGFDHISDLDADVMEGLETEILAQMGVSDPYAEQD